MKNLSIVKVLLTVGVFLGISTVPNYAAARTSVHINLPGISIGVADRQYRDRYNHRYHNNYYQRYYYSPAPSRTIKRRTIKRTYRYNNYYQPSQRIYTPSYRSEICPEPGYSPYYYQGHGCRQHYDHYHCE